MHYRKHKTKSDRRSITDLKFEIISEDCKHSASWGVILVHAEQPGSPVGDIIPSNDRNFLRYHPTILTFWPLTFTASGGDDVTNWRGQAAQQDPRITIFGGEFRLDRKDFESLFYHIESQYFFIVNYEATP